MEYLQYFINPIKNHYFDFDGRTRRRDYWLFILFYFIVSVIANIIDAVILGVPVLSLLLALALFLPSLGIAVRRLHDIGKSGWWVLINLVPLIGGIWFIILAATDSTPGSNAYGPNPKGE
jgi:uncharacterized membrane protein YhaH (DUF805 family)